MSAAAWAVTTTSCTLCSFSMAMKVGIAVPPPSIVPSHKTSSGVVFVASWAIR